MAATVQNYQISQGEELSSQLTLQLQNPDGSFSPIDLSGSVSFLFTAKTDNSLPDTDPSVVQITWQETTTPTLGQTFLTVVDTTTQDMVAVNWHYLIRVMGAPGLPQSYDLSKGIISVSVPTSNRIV